MSRYGVLLSLIAVQVFFGVHYLAAKLVLEEVPPRAWAFVRIAGAAVVLWAICRLSGRTVPREPKVWGLLALFSFFGVAINQVCFVEGLSRTTPTHSALMNTTIPVSTLVIAVLYGQERIRARQVLALLTALAGVLLVIRPWAAGVTAEIKSGDLLTLINATSFSFFLVISKRLMMRIDALAGTAILLTFGALMVGILGVPPLLEVNIGGLSARFWWLALFIILLPTAAAYVINYWALGKVDSSLVAFFIFLQPAIAATLSWVILGERPAPLMFVGAALIFLGVGSIGRPVTRTGS
ncbi:MAG: EamA family transporter [Acidobacteria bacterium]|nr:EamA family transporter [Acidobacteriota bacterium]NIM60868.1 EamA family transporter [Acidobacteriota bacterium]NIO60402.1 EamA family transporter [Acidobacteriota bacterium]NIQ31497.1 EamA family transporter [Acidobacteriota bacterium]NIQ86733.1 EamA family transporter [Acidobacteriota bacterium]